MCICIIRITGPYLFHNKICLVSCPNTNAHLYKIRLKPRTRFFCKTLVTEIRSCNCTERKITRNSYYGSNDIIMDSKKIIIIAAIFATTFGEPDNSKYTLFILQNVIQNIKIINIKKCYHCS